MTSAAAKARAQLKAAAEAAKAKASAACPDEPAAKVAKTAESPLPGAPELPGAPGSAAGPEKSAAKGAKTAESPEPPGAPGSAACPEESAAKVAQTAESPLRGETEPAGAPGEPAAEVADAAASPLQGMPEPAGAPLALGPTAAAGASAESAAGPAASDSVPCARLAATSFSMPVTFPRWQDPGDKSPDSVDTRQTMKLCVAWLTRELPAAMDKMKKLASPVNGSLEAVSPLAIQEGSGLRNYKETWTPANCQVSIRTTGMYEAGGSLFWLDPGFVGEHVHVLHQAAQWSTVVRYAEQFFSRAACLPEESEGAAACPSSGLGRLLFPCPLEAYETDPSRDWLRAPAGIKLLAGQPMVLAWYLAAARALQRADDALLLALWQAALTCTITVHNTESFSKLALSAVAASEKYVRFADMTDTFFFWATKVQAIMDAANEEKTPKMSAQVMAQRLADLGVRYRGALVQKGHVLSVGHVHDMFDEPSWRVLRIIEHEFGRSVLSTDHTKVSRFLAVVRSSALSVAAPSKLKEVLAALRPPRAHPWPTPPDQHVYISLPRFSMESLSELRRALSPTGAHLRAGAAPAHAALPLQRHQAQLVHPRGLGRAPKAAGLGADDHVQIPCSSAGVCARGECPELQRRSEGREGERLAGARISADFL